MRAKEFVKEDGFTPAQQAAQRAGMGTKAWVGGPALSARSKLPYVGAVLSVNDAIDRWQAGDRTGAVISTLAAVGYIVPGPYGWVVATGLETVNSMRDSGLGQDPFGPLPDNYITTQKKMKQPWDHPPINEESASDINPDTGKPWTYDEVRKLQNSINPATGKKWTPDEWRMYWDYGTNRPYTEKEKEMFGKPEDGPKNLGRFILSRTPVIGDIMAIGDAIKGFKDLSR